MRAAGLAVEVPTRGRPVVHLVVLDDGSGTPQIDRVVDFSTDDTDLATQLHDMAAAIRSRLSGLRVDRVVLRRADRPPVPSNTEGPRLRLLFEGAVIGAARSVIVETSVGTGKDTGAWFGSNKDGVDSAAKALLINSSKAVGKYLEATSAGLAALSL